MTRVPTLQGSFPPNILEPEYQYLHSSGSIVQPWSIAAAWQVFGDIFHRAVELQVSSAQQDISFEILFCLLGGSGITFEHNRSAAEIVARLDPFAVSWDDDDLRDAIEASLNLPQFEPRRHDGSLRRYRFPHRKAAVIVNARSWLARHEPLATRLESIASPTERRRFLCGCPGIGPKTASWLLRNLGWSDQVAILDIHVLRALSTAGRMPDQARLPRDYDVVEEAFLAWCRELDASPAAFDLFVWEWQRGTLSAP